MFRNLSNFCKLIESRWHILLTLLTIVPVGYSQISRSYCYMSLVRFNWAGISIQIGVGYLKGMTIVKATEFSQAWTKQKLMEKTAFKDHG